MANYLVVGLGRFGRSVARTLYENNQDVLAIDDDEETVQQAIDSDLVSEAIVLDASDETAIKNVIKDNFDVAFVCIGSNMQASIMVTLLLKEAGIPKIIAKAQSRAQGKVLEKIGADEVIYPEEFMGKRTANKILRPTIVEHFKLSNKFAPKSFSDKTLIQLDVRKKYGINIIGIKDKNNEVNISPAPDTMIKEGDTLIVVADNKKLNELNRMK
mgnify:CR=1 FL=1